MVNIRRKNFFLIGIIFVLSFSLIGLCIWYFVFHSPDYSGKYRGRDSGKVLSFEEAMAQFDESFVRQVLISVEAYDLHSPPFSSDTPKILFYIDDEAYHAEISDGEITVARGMITDQDIIFWTSKEEAVRMIVNREYIDDSFLEGHSRIELSAGKLELASKGYLSLYQELTGKDLSDLL